MARIWRSIIYVCILLVGGVYAARFTRSTQVWPKRDATPAPAAAPTEPAASDVETPTPTKLAASTDVEAPTPLTSKTLTGRGVNVPVSYYYGFTADPGTISIKITGRNRPSGFATALKAVVTTLKAERLCDEQLGNTREAETKTMACALKVAQPLLLRLYLDEDTIDYRVVIDGPVHLAPPDAQPPTPPAFEAVAGSTDSAAPTPLRVARIKGTGTDKTTSYYYALTVGPGEITLTADGKNRPSGMTTAVVLRLRAQSPGAEQLCEAEVGNETRGNRTVATCRIEEQVRAILTVVLEEDTLEWRAKVEGAVTLASAAGG